MELNKQIQLWWAALRKKLEVRGRGAEQLYHYEPKAKQLKPCFSQKTLFDDITPQQVEALYKDATKGQLGVILPGGQGPRLVTVDAENIFVLPELREVAPKAEQHAAPENLRENLQENSPLTNAPAVEEAKIPPRSSAPSSAEQVTAADSTRTVTSKTELPLKAKPSPTAEPRESDLSPSEDIPQEERSERRAELENALSLAQSPEEQANVYQQMLLEDEEEELRRKRLNLIKLQSARTFFLTYVFEEQKIADMEQFKRDLLDDDLKDQELENTEGAASLLLSDKDKEDPDFESMSSDRCHYVSDVVTALGDGSLLLDEQQARKVIDNIVSGRSSNALKSSSPEDGKQTNNASAEASSDTELPPPDGAMLGNSLRQLVRYTAGEYPLSNKHVEVARLCSDMLQLAKQCNLSAEQLKLDSSEFTAILGTIELGRIVKHGLAAKEALSSPNPPTGFKRSAALRDYLTMSAVEQAITPYARTLQEAAISREDTPLSSMQILLGNPGFSSADLSRMITRSSAMRELLAKDPETTRQLVSSPSHEMDDLARQAMSSCYNADVKKTAAPTAPFKRQPTRSALRHIR